MRGIIVKIKKLNPEAKLPKKGSDGCQGYDVYATSKEFDEKTGCVIFGTGLSIEPPKGYGVFLMARSSIYKTPLLLANGVGLGDNDYRGEYKFVFRTVDRPKVNYEIGDRIGQLVFLPIPEVAFVESEDLTETDRGEGGFGSTGG